MASALASLPPPFSRGPVDLKANARRFLERALVISALVHLAVLGVFRAADERSRALWDRANPDVKVWEHPVDVVRLIPFDPTRSSAPSVISDEGVIDPIDRDVPIQKIDPGTRRIEFPGVVDVPGTSREPGPTPPGPEPPPNPEPAFVIVDTPPVPILSPRPPYPPWAKDALIEGKVLVRMLVGTDGIPKKAVVVRGPKGLTEGLESALLRWRFKPALANGRPVEVWVEIPISFRLGD